MLYHRLRQPWRPLGSSAPVSAEHQDRTASDQDAAASGAGERTVLRGSGSSQKQDEDGGEHAVAQHDALRSRKSGKTDAARGHNELRLTTTVSPRRWWVNGSQALLDLVLDAYQSEVKVLGVQMAG